MIDFSMNILGIDGNPALDENKKPLTVGAVCVTALLHEGPGADNSSFTAIENKVKRAIFAQRIVTDKSLTLTVEQIADLKTRVAQVGSPLAVLRVWEALDPSAVDALR